MRYAPAVGLFLSATILAACATTQPHGVPVDVVISKLKARLKEVVPLDLNYIGKAGCVAGGHYRIVAYPTKASVQLKTVLTKTNTAGIGGKFGIPYVATPSIQHIASSVKTAQMTMAFCVEPEDLTMTATPASPETDCTWKLKDKDAHGKTIDLNYVHTLWPSTKTQDLGDQTVKPDDQVFTITPQDQPSNTDLVGALHSAVGGLIYSNHTDACLVPQNIDVQLAFQVTGQTDAGLKLDFVIVNIQDTLSRKDDYTNMLDVTFALNKGSTVTLDQK
jgi:hypothetical protein